MKIKKSSWRWDSYKEVCSSVGETKLYLLHPRSLTKGLIGVKQVMNVCGTQQAEETTGEKGLRLEP